MLSCIYQGRNVCRSWGFYVLTNFTIHFTLYLISRFWTIYIYILYIIYIYILYIYIYTGVKLSPTFGRCPRWLIFFRSVFYQNNWNNCKEVMNRGGGQIRGALYNFFVVKKCLFCIFQMYYNRFIKSFHEQVCLIIFNGRYYFDRYFFHHWAIV